ncbi:MAG: SCO family protein [Candidatus Dadabacteria bacterium]|nr:SCO family protein [Candidatus Dadabacteria bacterium]
MNRLRILKIAWVAALVFMLLGVGVLWMLRSYGGGGYYGTVREVEAPPFTLKAHNGETVELSDFRGKAVLMFFGFTNCPDVCPTTMRRLNEVMDLLGELRSRVRVLFITVDPERDTVERLREYVTYYGEEFLGLTGTMEDIEHVASSYHVFFARADEDDSKSGYLMNHTSSVFLITPGGRRYLRYSQQDSEPGMIARDIRRVLN